MRTLFACVLLFALPSLLAEAATLLVPSQYSTIQQAINAAPGQGDLILVTIKDPESFLSILGAKHAISGASEESFRKTANQLIILGQENGFVTAPR